MSQPATTEELRKALDDALSMLKAASIFYWKNSRPITCEDIRKFNEETKLLLNRGMFVLPYPDETARVLRMQRDYGDENPEPAA